MGSLEKNVCYITEPWIIIHLIERLNKWNEPEERKKENERERKEIELSTVAFLVREFGDREKR